MQHILVFVYRCADHGDCTNGGVTSKYTSFELFWDCESEDALRYCKENNINPEQALFLVKRKLWGEDYSYAEPLTKKPGKWYMMGGNFVYTCDSRLYKMDGKMCASPIPVFDRYEEYTEQYD